MPDILRQRRTLLDSGALLLEDSALPVDQPLGRGYSAEAQIVLPYFGAFGWRTSGATKFIDANSILFVAGGEEFEEHHPLSVGHGSLIVTPDAAMLDELQPHRSRLPSATASMTDNVRLLTHRLRSAGPADRLATEEQTLTLLCTLLPMVRRNTAASRSVVDRAKVYLHAQGHAPLSLSTVARAVGVSPVYLTQSFTRLEGMPLYRYQMRLRLNRALNELPRCEDLTGLALDLGFSSHSHFSTAFRAAFGIAPSHFRSAVRHAH